jgi:kynurenine formamidase
VFLKALIIRTLPNDNTKMSRNYSAQKPPFLSLDAMNFITELGVEHILVDLPSIDRAYDQGKLNTHHLFWNVASGSHETSSHSLVNKTITEMIYAADEIPDGSYLLNLQIAPFASDAAPSRPLLYPLIKA